MSSLTLTAYLLIWPVLAAAVLVVLCASLARDMRNAKRDGDDLV